jgi:uncharacterized membrane-anchored protein YhcB (DUF1043 family)
VSELMIQILSGVGLFFLGVMLGAVFHRSFQGETSKNKRLEQKLAELQDTHSRYQAEVSEHFMDTAKAVQTLTKSYQDVHSKLAKGASRLCNDDHSGDFLSINFSSDNSDSVPNLTDRHTNLSDHYAPPMDYAPKETPDAEGTLSERYGLQDSDIAESDLDEQDTPQSKDSPYGSELAEKEKNHELSQTVKQESEQHKTT